MEMFLKEYLAHIKLEKNLSKNTVSSYKNDITAFISYLKNKGKEDPSIISSNDIGGFFKTLNELGLIRFIVRKIFLFIKRILFISIEEQIHFKKSH